MTDRQHGRTHRGAPFGLPISKGRWYLFAILGFWLSIFTIGTVYKITPASLVGPISIAEASGLAFLAVYLIGGIGPLSPFRVRGDWP